MTVVAGVGGILQPSGYPWIVTTRAIGSGVAGVSEVDEHLVVMVGENSSRKVGTMARLSRTGSACVQCVDAPQAMLSRDGDLQMVPELPGLTQDVVLGPRDFIVMSSAGVLAHLPHGLAYVLRRAHDGAALSVEALLEEMLSYSKSGGVAIVRRGA